MRMRLSSKVAAAAAALGAGGMLAALAPAGPAVAYYSPPLLLDVQIESPASLIARGAAVDLPVEVTCTADQVWGYVSVTQRVGRDIVQGYASFYLTDCSEPGERHVVRVLAPSGGRAFTQGTAVATAEIQGCTDNWICGRETDTETVSIRR